MSTPAQTFVIVGACLTGAKAAQELRDQGFDGRVVLIGDEQELPYERPPLTKDYLRDEQPRDKARVHEVGFYEQHDIELLTGVTVTAIEPASKRVLADGGKESRLRPAVDRHRSRAAQTRYRRRRPRWCPLPSHPARLRRPS